MSTPGAPDGTLAAVARWTSRGENFAAGTVLVLMALLPCADLLIRTLHISPLPGSTALVMHLTLWVGFLGAIVTSREKRHLALSTGIDRLPPRWRRWPAYLTSTVSAGTAAALTWASWEFVRVERDPPAYITSWLPPVWVLELVLPLSFAVMTLRFVLQAEGWIGKGVALLGIPAAWAVGFVLHPHAASLLWPGIVLLLVAAVLGSPIFVAMGGSALLLFFAEDIPVATVPVEAYRLVTSPSIPMIPLFTFAGFILAQGRAGERLLRLFRALFGWAPGGLAVVATLICAFFTTFTGASGVTILALGGLLLPMLKESGYGEKFSIGLVTAAGSIGLLFPPSLPVILYGIAAKVNILDLYKAAALPGALLVLAVAVFGVLEARRRRIPRQPFAGKEAALALWEAKWEVFLPVVALVGLFGGFCTMVEAAALTAAYALLVGVVIHREISLRHHLPRILASSAALIGGVMVILGVAMGLTNYMVEAQVPMKAAAWAAEHIHSKWLFLLGLNLFLIVVGAMMDIFSAIMVVVPLMLPVATATFGIHPLHLGVIFLANMELGYLMPPVGENLFLASYRFDKPLLRVAACALPFILAILVAVLVITYLPWLTFLGSPPQMSPK